jgi:5-deoxy-glucuronate isomerase
MKYTSDNLRLHPYTSQDPGVIVEVDPEQAGWENIHFQARRLAAGQTWSFALSGFEIALVALAGTLRVTSNRGTWDSIGRRANVFAGLPEALYLPAGSNLTVSALTNCQFAAAWVPAVQNHPPRLIRQEDISVEIRGGDNATRQINGIIRPGFDCERLVLVEVYTPGGNWSSYPPHKHDVHRVDEHGHLLEANLEEIYYYKIDRPEGYAFQRIYTDANSPLQQAGAPIDTVLMLQNDDLVLIPEGYHPVTSAPGYTTYYLNVLAGSAQSLASADDPHFSWVKSTFQRKDPRVPLYPVDSRQLIS